MKNIILTVLVGFIAICTTEAQEGISISNFKADNLSDSELLISVDYSCPEDLESKDIFIQAFPVMNDGRANFKGIRIENSPIEAGNHQASIKIYKKTGGKNFNSKSIKICMTTIRKKNLLCEEFPFAKSWVDIGNMAKINSFHSSENQVKKGDLVTLTWETENTSMVMLGKFGTANFDEVPASGSKNVVLDRTSTYVLMASPKSLKGPTKVESKKIKISVTNIEPVIGSFYTDHPTIRRGIESKLQWKAFGADRVTLNGKSVPAIGDKSVSPTRTTNYSLIAQTGDKIIKENLTVYVTPFAAPKLSPPFYSLELCRRINVNKGSSRCISSDGPFTTGDEIFVMARFKNLPKGNYIVKRVTYNGFFNSDKWTKAHQEESSFQNPGKDEGLLTFSIVNLGEGAKKLKIILNDEQGTSCEIVYCIDCSRMWE